MCDLLPHADPKTGLFPVEIVDSVGRLESREVVEEVSVKTEDVKEKLCEAGLARSTRKQQTQSPRARLYYPG